MNSSKSPALPVPSLFSGVFFVTLRMRDALPASFGQNLGLQYYSKQVELADWPDRNAKLLQARKRLFARFDQALDLEKYGLSHLREPMLAQIVADEIHRHDGSDYALLAYAILPNHVHILFDLRNTLAEDPPLDDLQSFCFKPLRDIVADIQNATESSLKKTLRRLGEHVDPSTFQKHHTNGGVKMEGKFWHEHSFDFRIHDDAEYEKVVWYILQNPVKAEVVGDWREWPFSYHSGS